jgi:hypothetical protein
MDDVCVCNHTLEELLQHWRRVLELFKEDDFKLCLKKYFFGLHEVECLAYIIGRQDFSFDQES